MAAATQTSQVTRFCTTALILLKRTRSATNRNHISALIVIRPLPSHLFQHTLNSISGVPACSWRSMVPECNFDASSSPQHHHQISICWNVSVPTTYGWKYLSMNNSNIFYIDRYSLHKRLAQCLLFHDDTCNLLCNQYLCCLSSQATNKCIDLIMEAVLRFCLW
jgi:hypothetical protein